MGTSEACQLWLGVPSIFTAERAEGTEMERKRGTNLCGPCDLSGEIVAILLGQRPPVRTSFLDNLAARG